MTTDTLHPLATEYLDRLRRAGRVLPSERRQELLADIEGHLSEAIAPDATDAEVRTALARLGAPEAIIAAELPEPASPQPRHPAWDWLAVVLLLLGGFLVGVGWLAGVVALWTSRTWNVRDKLIGTLVIPGGLALGLLVGLAVTGTPVKTRCRGVAGALQSCRTVAGHANPILPTGLGITIFVILMVAPIATTVYLIWRTRSNRAQY